METNRPTTPIGHFFHMAGRILGWMRAIVVNGLFLLLLILVISSLVGSIPEPLPNKGPLRVTISGVLVDQRNTLDPVAAVLSQGQGSGQTLVREVVQAIDRGAEDDRITALVLELNLFAGGGISKLEEIGSALSRFKASGKPIIAVSDLYTQNQYYLASYADQVYLHPMGSVLLTGYGAYRNYFQEGLEKLDVDVNVFRVGDYKDAVEPYTRSGMSEASREHNSQWINQLWNVYTSRVENQRQLPKDAINDYINNYDQHLLSANNDAAQLALDTRLVDTLATRGEVREALVERFGKNRQGDSYLSLNYRRYLQEKQRQPRPASDKVGLIVASGTIYDGNQPPGNIGGDSLAKLIRQAREEEKVDALVLRIDSGGGSAYASEVIRNELEATQATGIPLVVSMGSVAASGGYWIAVGADEIWATPTTLTGSIGVFGVFPTFQNSLEKLGITTDGVGTTELSDAMRLDMPVSPMAASVLQSQVDNIYQQFITLVADARDSTPEAIHEIAQGRVWSGSMAQNLGLVDNLGNLDDAIEAAAQRAEIDDYTVKLIEPVLTPWQQFTRNLSARAQSLALQLGLEYWGLQQQATGIEALTQSEPWHLYQDMITMLNQSRSQRGIYAHCLQCVLPD